MTKFSSLTFSTTDIIKGIGGVLFIGSAWYHIIKSQDELKQMISEVKIYKTADDKVVNNRLEKLEYNMSLNSNRINELEKWKYKVDAIIPEKLKIKGE